MNQQFQDALTKLLEAIPLYVLVVAGLILLSAFIAYVAWFRPNAASLGKSLKVLAAALHERAQAPGLSWEAARVEAEEAAVGHEAVESAWRETESRVIPLQDANGTRFIMFGAPRDVWSAPHLLAKGFNLSLAEAIPNLLVGIGLLFTFFFLTLALTEATSALGNTGSSSPISPIDATKALLQTAGSKFVTSLAGLFASICWSFAARRWMSRLHREAEKVIENLSRCVAVNGGERATLRGVADTASLLQKSGDQVDLTGELLAESREQTGALKRFETDLAVSLANAISSAFSPQFEEMTNRLTSSIDGLSAKMSSMNQEALEQILQQFGDVFKQATQTEMEELRSTLKSMATNLENAGNGLTAGVNSSADRLDKVGSDLMVKMGEVVAGLVSSAAGLGAAAQDVKLAMNDMDVTIHQLTSVGKEGASAAREILTSADATTSKLASAAEAMVTAGATVHQAVGKLAEVADSVEELSEGQRDVVVAVQGAVPRAIELVEGVVGLLAKTASQTAFDMRQVRESMDGTTKALSATVSSITEGISEYTKQVAELHRSMDASLAKAVSSLDKSIDGLEEAIEGLVEVLPSPEGRSQ